MWHQEAQTTGIPKGTRPAQEELRHWSAEETSDVSERFFCVPVHRRVEDASFQSVKRTSLETELGPFPFSRGGVGEGNRSAQEKLAAVELHFLVPISPLKGVLRQN